MRVLLIEDDQTLREHIIKLLQEDGYACDAVTTAEDGNFMLKENDYDVVILDLLLPDGSGLDVLKHFRATGKAVPVLILSALGGVHDRVGGLDLGADDYLVKPFEPAELLARVRALVRRRYQQPDPIVRCGNLTINTRTREVTRGRRRIELKPKEYAVLEVLARNLDTPVTRTMLWEHIYDWDYDGMSNTVDVYVSRLRSKIDVEGEKPLIHTVRGVGYMLSANR
ncbi:MAG: response regulator transcription factor [bacterium]|nr:response regulator transcription factor [bacterium]